MRQHYLISVGIFFLALFLFTWGMSAQEITSFDSRFYLFAKEMWRNGVSWFPTTYNQPYPDYPVTSTLLIYAIAKLFGGLNKFIAVLPSAIAAAWTVVLTYRIGNLHDRNWGLIAVCFTLMTLMFLKCARSISLDMYPTLITAWCFYLVYKLSPDETQNVSSGLRVARIKTRFLRFDPGLTAIYLLLAASFAFRGPIGLVMPAGVICSYYFLTRQWKRLFVFGITAFILLLVCTALLFFAAYHTGGQVFLQDVLRMQVAGRIDNTFQPIYFYFTNSLGNYAISYPLALVVIVALITRVVLGHSSRVVPGHNSRVVPGHNSRVVPRLDRGIQHSTLLLCLIGWTLIIMIGMSIPGDKKARYILPIVPAIALIAAYPFAIRWRKVFSVFVVAIIALTLDVIYIKGIEPALLLHDKTAEFVTAVETLREKAHAKLIFYREQPDGTPIKYQVYNEQGDIPEFIETEQQLLNNKQNAFYITSEDYFSQLSPKTLSHFTILARDKVGHVMMVVFARKK